MAQSFQQAHAALVGGNSNQSGGGTTSGAVTSFQQAHQQLIQSNQTNQSSPKVTNNPVRISPTPQVQNPSILDKVRNSLANVGKTVLNFEANLPQAHFADTISKYTPAGWQGKVTALGAGIAQGAINSIPEYARNTKNVISDIKTHNTNVKQVAGDVAGAVANSPMLLLLGDGLFKGAEEAGKAVLPTVIKTGGKALTKDVVLSALKTAGKGLAKDTAIGAGYGALQGVASGRDITTANDYAKNLLDNIKVGAGVTGAIGGVSHIVIPLAKSAGAKAGAMFVTKTGDKVKLDHMTVDPQGAQSVVVANDKLAKSPAGKAIVKASIQANESGQHVLIQPATDGQYAAPNGQKINVGVVQPYEPKQEKPLNIEPSSNLTSADKKIESKFTDHLQNNYDDAVTQYNSLPDSEGGKVLNTDTARELSEDYQKDRTKSAAVHEPSSAFIKALYKQKLEEPIKNGKDVVLFTAGGTGSGKSTAIKNIPEIQAISDHAKLVYDTNSNKPETAISKIQQALDTGHKVGMVYVHREPVEALRNGALPRAMRMGRTVPLSAHVETHVGAPASVLKIAEHFKDNPNFSVRAIDNTRGRGEAVKMPIENLHKISYNKEDLNAELHQVLEHEYTSGKISREVYEGTRQSEVKAGRDNGQHGTRNDAQSEQKRQGARAATKNSVNPEESPKITREYDEKGKLIENKNKSLLKGNEVTAIKNVIDAKFKHLRETAKGAGDIEKGVDAIIKDITDRSKGDKIVLSALRKALNDEMYGFAGGGSYIDQHHTLMGMLEHDEEMSPVISSMMEHKRVLDEALIGTPDPTYQRPAMIERKTPPKKQEGLTSAQEPVGTGNLRESAAYKHFVEQLAADDPETYAKIKDDPKLLYNKVNQEYDFEKAMEFVQKDPQKAYDVAKGYAPAPEGIRVNSITDVLSKRALKEGDLAMVNSLERSLSLRSTRYGQENYALKGRFDGAEPQAYIQKLLDMRLKKLGGESGITKTIDMAAKKFGKDLNTAKSNAIAKIDRIVEKAQQFTKKERQKIDFAQKLLDELTCK